MSNLRRKQKRKRYLALIMGILMEQYVYTHDPDTKVEIDRLKAELAEINKVL